MKRPTSENEEIENKFPMNETECLPRISVSSEEVSDDKDVDYSPESEEEEADENTQLLTGESSHESDNENLDMVDNAQDLTDAVEKNKSRKRVRRMQDWKQFKKREKKRKGEEYKTKKGIVKRAKALQSACKCRLQCDKKIDEFQRQNIFSTFYNLSRHAQDQVLAESVEEKLKDRQRLALGKNESRRSFSRKYYLKDAGGYRTQVCQKMYLKTYDISIKKIRVIVEKKRDHGGVYPPDGRGMHKNQPKIDEKLKDIVRNHIKSFPAYTSHYSREKTSRRYLSPDLNLSIMYRLYLEKCKELNVASLKEFQYRKFFNEEFNLAFHHPLNDTCGKCDRLNNTLKTLSKSNLTEEEIETKVQVENELKDHLEMAKKCYENKKKDKERSKSDSSFLTVSFDLEKCLPTPYLRNGVSFYKRQLWVYNLTLYKTDDVGNQGICFLWDETIAGRGGQEIASCLRQFVLNIPSKNIKTINFYSDSCSGQNRNIYVATMFCNLLQELPETCSITEINHTFMEPGHTHMEADTIHAAIERAKKKTIMEIEVPHDWTNFIKSVYRKNPLSVNEVGQEKFLNYNNVLKKNLVHRKKNEEGDMVPWMQIKQMKFKRNLEYQFLYKTDFKDGDFKKVDLRRGTLRNRKNLTDLVEPLHKEQLPIANQKFDNLMELLPYISNHNQNYFKNLKRSSALDADDYPAIEEEA